VEQDAIAMLIVVAIVGCVGCNILTDEGGRALAGRGAARVSGGGFPTTVFVLIRVGMMGSPFRGFPLHLCLYLYSSAGPLILLTFFRLKIRILIRILTRFVRASTRFLRSSSPVRDLARHEVAPQTVVRSDKQAEGDQLLNPR